MDPSLLHGKVCPNPDHHLCLLQPFPPVPSTVKQDASRKSLFDLPKNIRASIYTYAGLVRSCPVELGSARPTSSIQETCSYHTFHGRTVLSFKHLRRTIKLDCHCPGLNVGLMCLSRAIHQETRSLMLSANRFNLTLLEPDGVRRPILEGIPPAALAGMTSFGLSLSLSMTDAIFHRSTQNFDERALNILTRSIAALARSQVCRPYQLRLAFSCRSLNALEAGSILRHLEAFSFLKDCALSIDTESSEDLRPLLRTLAFELTGRRPVTQPFPFDLLSPEIRLLVLERTDLVGRSNIPTSYTARLNCCKRCVDSLRTCCCNNIRSAYSTTCACWVGPGPLASVSRRWYLEATQVFFGRNSFDFGGLGMVEHACQFFQKLPLDSLYHVRKIQLHIDSHEADQWTVNNVRLFLVCWQHLVGLLAGKLDRPRVTLGINFSWSFTGATITPDARDMDCLAIARIIALTHDMIRPLRSLAGLRALFIFTPLFPDVEAWAEKLVMGENYDSIARGKVPVSNRDPCYPLNIYGYRIVPTIPLRGVVDLIRSGRRPWRRSITACPRCQRKHQPILDDDEEQEEMEQGQDEAGA